MTLMSYDFPYVTVACSCAVPGTLTWIHVPRMMAEIKTWHPKSAVPNRERGSTGDRSHLIIPG